MSDLDDKIKKQLDARWAAALEAQKRYEQECADVERFINELNEQPGWKAVEQELTPVKTLELLTHLLKRIKDLEDAGRKR